jgi:nitrite reductase/ring-hydroxylating ferredoxin subunit
VRAAGRDALVIEADLRAEQVCHAVVAETVGHFGRLDVLLNNAAFQRSISDGFESLSSEQLERTFATNVFATAGLLGGHLAYARGVGVSTTAFQAGPDEWTDLIAVDQLDRQRPPTAVSRDGVGYVAITVDDDIHVLENRCTHRGAPLAEGTVVGGCIERPWHASRFSLTDGRVAKGPASVDQPAYETRVVDGRVEIRRTELGGLRRASTRP